MKIIQSFSDFYTKWLTGVDSDWDIRNSEGGSRLNQAGTRSSVMNMSRRSSRMVCFCIGSKLYNYDFRICHSNRHHQHRQGDPIGEVFSMTP